MIYKLAHFFQAHLAFLWNSIEYVNAWLFKIRYGQKVQEIAPTILAQYPQTYAVSPADIPALESFFSKQPAEAFEYFKPHDFDEKTLLRLAKNPSFLMYMVKDGDEIVGYFFLRSFFMGKSFLGKMVDFQSQGKGIGKKMCCCAMDLASAIGLKMFETISKDNLASLYSTQNVLEVRIIKEMSNNYIYIEDVRKKSGIHLR